MFLQLSDRQGTGYNPRSYQYIILDSLRLGEKDRHQLLSIMRIHDKDTRKYLTFQPGRYSLLQPFQKGKRCPTKGEAPFRIQPNHVICFITGISIPLKERCFAPSSYGTSLGNNFEVKLFQRQLSSLGKAHVPIRGCTVVGRMAELVSLNIEDTRQRSLGQTNTS